jgi:hypothetical protein
MCQFQITKLNGAKIYVGQLKNHIYLKTTPLHLKINDLTHIATNFGLGCHMNIIVCAVALW